ncbi:MAG: hypothetical protein SGBAC_009751 [Bacillariaceae sp.]
MVQDSKAAGQDGPPAKDGSSQAIPKKGNIPSPPGKDTDTISIPRKKRKHDDDLDEKTNVTNVTNKKTPTTPAAEATPAKNKRSAPNDAPTSTARKRQKRKEKNRDKRKIPSIYDDDSSDEDDDDSRMIGNVKDYYDYDYDDDDDDVQNKEKEQGLSVRDLKMKILGRDVDSSRPPRQRPTMASDLGSHALSKVPATKTAVTPTAASTDSTLSKKKGLKEELTCLICQAVFLDPISLPCGHSFCKNCAEWWFLQPHKRDRKDCPTCRKAVPYARGYSDTPDIQINVALRACVMALFPDSVKKRIHATTAGEDGGKHSRGYEQVIPLDQDNWRRMDYNTSMFAKQQESFLQVRHNVVSDEQDQRMHVGLCLFGLPEQMVDDSSTLIIRLVLMTMEEDEADDMDGLPVFTTPSDVGDHYFICTHQDRYQYSFWEVASCASPPNDDNENNTRSVYNYNWEPIGRFSTDQEGFMTDSHGVIEYQWQPRNKHRRLRFKHSETGAEMEVDMTQLDLKMLRDAAARADVDDLQDKPTTCFVYDQHDRDMEDEDSHAANEYEDDGFIVKEEDASDDDSASEVSGEFSTAGAASDDGSDASTDVCHVCNKVGDLVLCCAGEDDDEIGCGKAFHVTCIGRTKVPTGDWICTECAKSENDLSLVVSLTSSDNPNYGYEFPEFDTNVAAEASDNSDSDEEISTSRKKSDKVTKTSTKTLEDSDSEDEIPASKPKGKKSKAAVLDDSDSEDEIAQASSKNKKESKANKKTSHHLHDSSDEEMADVPSDIKPSEKKTQRRVIAEDSDSD